MTNGGKGEPMSDLIRREEVVERLEIVINYGIPNGNGIHLISAESTLETIKELPTAEPTIDDIAERISNTDWYHIFKGELRHGAHDREEALFKAEDIFNVLKDMGASDEHTDKRD